MKLIIAITLILALTVRADWVLQQTHFAGGFTEADVAGVWSANRNTNGLVGNCGGTPLVGGPGKFSQNLQLSGDIFPLNQHDSVRLVFDLWQLDSWDGAESFHVDVDGVRVLNMNKASGPWGGIARCGNGGYNDELIQNVTIDVAHTADSVSIVFQDSLNEDTNNESWGISNLRVYAQSTCEDNNIGYLCLTDEEAQACFDHLDTLSEADQQNPSVSNECEPIVRNDIQQYDFDITYEDAPGYFQNDDCTTHTVDFENTRLSEGNDPTDQWTFDGETQNIHFTILHDDLEPTYGCEKIVEPTQYTWICDMTLTIYVGGIPQFEYSYQMTTTLSRDNTDTLTVTVAPNLVTGDCCENTLQIQTSLNFCLDMNCNENEFLPAPLTVERLDDIYVVHAIETQEFQYYFLHGLSLKLGAIIPQIVATDASQQGKIIYHFRSNIAMDGMTIEAISRIAENPQARLRRALQEGEEITEEDDYKIKATSMMSIVAEGELAEQGKESEKESDNNTVLIVVLSVVGVLAIAGIIAGTVFFMRRKGGNNASNNNKNTEQKYEQKSVDGDAQAPADSEKQAIQA